MFTLDWLGVVLGVWFIQCHFMVNLGFFKCLFVFGLGYCLGSLRVSLN